MGVESRHHDFCEAVGEGGREFLAPGGEIDLGELAAEPDPGVDGRCDVLRLTPGRRVVFPPADGVGRIALRAWGVQQMQDEPFPLTEKRGLDLQEAVNLEGGGLSPAAQRTALVMSRRTKGQVQWLLYWKQRLAAK